MHTQKAEFEIQEESEIEAYKSGMRSFIWKP